MFVGLDLGTTNIKAVLVDAAGAVVARSGVPVGIVHTPDGGVEQDIDDIWSATLTAIKTLGRPEQRAAVQAAADRVPNVRYLGWLPAAQVPLYMQMADVIYYCLKPDYPGAKYNAPNTLSQAMAASRPLIANDVGDLGRIVRQADCGILIPAVTPGAIRQAAETLHDPLLRRKLGNAGREAAETRYNWEAAGQQLQRVYARLEGDTA